MYASFSEVAVLLLTATYVKEPTSANIVTAKAMIRINRRKLVLGSELPSELLTVPLAKRLSGSVSTKDVASSEMNVL